MSKIYRRRDSRSRPDRSNSVRQLYHFTASGRFMSGFVIDARGCGCPAAHASSPSRKSEALAYASETAEPLSAEAHKWLETIDFSRTVPNAWSPELRR